MSKEVLDGRAFEALADPSRRRLLLTVFDDGPHGDLDPLDLLGSRGTDDDPDVGRTALTHVHLPKLAGMGFLEWDRESGTVSRGANWEGIAPLLRWMSDHRDELPEEWLAGTPVEE
jgi:hypothetical protein